MADAASASAALLDPVDLLASARASDVAACRPGCGACCIAPSISAPLPGYPAGKLAGVRCPHLTAELRCALFGRPERPAVCRDLRPQPEMCGASAEEAMATLARWERLTAPATAPAKPPAR